MYSSKDPSYVVARHASQAFKVKLIPNCFWRNQHHLHDAFHRFVVIRWYCLPLTIKEIMSLPLTIGNFIFGCNDNWISAPCFPIFVERLEHLRTTGVGVLMISSLSLWNCSQNGGYVRLCLSLTFDLLVHARRCFFPCLPLIFY